MSVQANVEEMEGTVKKAFCGWRVACSQTFADHQRMQHVEAETRLDELRALEQKD